MSTAEPGWYPAEDGLVRYWDGNAWTEHTQPADPLKNEVSVVDAHVTVTETAVLTSEGDVPAGWYPQDSGDLRYWDGSAWTEHVQAQAQAQAQAALPPQTPVSPSGSAGGSSMTIATSNAQGTTSQVTVTQNYSPLVLPTDRSLPKYIFLGIITFFIYPLFVNARAADDLNTIASRSDGQRTMNYWLLFFILGPITMGIWTLVWWTQFCDRVGRTMRSRGMEPTVDASTFWLWCVLGSLIIVGPFVFVYKWLHAMNALCADYNAKGELAAQTMMVQVS